MNNEILNLDEAANLLKISVVTARRWCANGKLPAVKIGNHYRIRKADIDKLFDDKIKDKNKQIYEANNSKLS